MHKFCACFYLLLVFWVIFIFEVDLFYRYGFHLRGCLYFDVVLTVSFCPSVLVTWCTGVPVSECPSVPLSQCAWEGTNKTHKQGGANKTHKRCPIVLVSQCPCVPVSLCPCACVPVPWGDRETQNRGGGRRNAHFLLQTHRWMDGWTNRQTEVHKEVVPT